MTTPKTLRQVDFLVLAVLQSEPLHGYGIVRAIDELSGGRVQLRPGDVYRVLYRMQRAGLLESAGRSEVGGGDARRTYYRITESGKRVAVAEASLMANVSARVLATESDSGTTS